MSGKFSPPAVLTANSLTTGDVVYLAATGEWVADVAASQIAHDEPGIAKLEALASEAVKRGQVVETEVIPVTLETGSPWPTGNRERIRAMGPTVRQDLGNQARSAADTTQTPETAGA
ncbi:MAG: DUF2849 domain-containing protein [Pseudomonadota bacterium]